MGEFAAGLVAVTHLGTQYAKWLSRTSTFLTQQVRIGSHFPLAIYYLRLGVHR